MFEHQLRHATRSLPPGVARWTSRAVGSGWFQIAPGAYDDEDRSGSVWPIVAAALMAGVWVDGGLLPGHPEWGDVSRPSDRVEDFAAYFDLCADELGTIKALEIVRDELARGLGVSETDQGRVA